MPVQGSASLAGLTAYITWVTIRVRQMLGLHMVEDSQPTMVGELVAEEDKEVGSSSAKHLGL